MVTIILLQFVVLPLWTLFLLVILASIAQTAFANMAKSYYSAKLAYEIQLREMMFGDLQPLEKPMEEAPRAGQYSTT